MELEIDSSIVISANIEHFILSKVQLLMLPSRHTIDLIHCYIKSNKFSNNNSWRIEITQ